jgi:hypothetical protein
MTLRQGNIGIAYSQQRSPVDVRVTILICCVIRQFWFGCRNLDDLGDPMGIGPLHRQVALSTPVSCRYRLVTPGRLGRTLLGVAAFSIHFRATELRPTYLLEVRHISQTKLMLLFAESSLTVTMSDYSSTGNKYV